MEKAIYKMEASFGRMGNLEGIFVAEKQYIDYLLKHEVEIYFGEVLGKHSDVSGSLEQHEIKLVTDKEDFIKMFEEHGMNSGHNPLYYSILYSSVENEENEGMYDDWTVYDYIHYKLTGDKPNL
jgi:hypothetical protein